MMESHAVPAAGQSVQSHSLRKPLPLGRVLLIAAVWIYIIILVIAPVGALIVGTFKQGLQPVFAALAGREFLGSFWLTIQISVEVAAIQLVLGTLLAWVLVRHSFPGKSLLNGMIDLPFAVSPVVVGYMLLLVFGRNSFLGPALSSVGIKVAFAVPGMVLATLFVTLPMVVREMIPVIRRLDRAQELAAETLGASGWRTFWSVVFPALRTGLIYGTTLTLARALGEFGAILVIGGGIQGRTETTTLYIFRALEERQYAAAYSAALVIGLCTVTLVTVADWLRRRSGGE